MRPQGIIRPVFVAAFDHLHDQIMFLLRNGTPPRHGKRRCRHQRHGPVHKVKLLDQIPVMRRQMNLLVKSPVGPRKRRGFVPQRIVLLDHFTQHARLLGCGMARGKPCRQPFKRAAHDVKLRHLVVIERRDNQAAPVARQQRLRLKPLQCLADGGARHAETLCQFAFDKAITGLVGSQINRFENHRIGIGLAWALAGFIKRHEIPFVRMTIPYPPRPFAQARDLAPTALRA